MRYRIRSSREDMKERSKVFDANSDKEAVEYFNEIAEGEGSLDMLTLERIDVEERVTLIASVRI